MFLFSQNVYFLIVLLIVCCCYWLLQLDYMCIELFQFLSMEARSTKYLRLSTTNTTLLFNRDRRCKVLKWFLLRSIDIFLKNHLRFHYVTYMSASQVRCEVSLLDLDR